jgi:hypothetical protein
MTAATTGNTAAAFSWRDGKMTALPDVGGPCIANWRAPTGTIVGVGSRLTGNSADVQPLIWSSVEVRILDKLSGDSYGYAAAVNSSGDIVGYSDTKNNNNNARAVLWRGGRCGSTPSPPSPRESTSGTAWQSTSAVRSSRTAAGPEPGRRTTCSRLASEPAPPLQKIQTHSAGELRKWGPGGGGSRVQARTRRSPMRKRWSQRSPR